MKWLSDSTVDHLRALTELPDLEGTRYRVERELGRGGMGIVYLAEDTALNRQVALKVLHTPLMSPEMVQRMLREATVIAQLEHPGIVPVHDAGTLPDGRVFYVMKFVRGQSLTESVPLIQSLKDRARIFLKACEAVAFAHANGVIHRDLKPDNIMLGPFGEVLVMDWGTAKILQRDEQNKIESVSTEKEMENDPDRGLVIGTRAYMSPEQARGDEVDQRSDIYSLGAVLSFLLDPRPPSEASTLVPGAAEIPVQRAKTRVFSQPVPKQLAAICNMAMSDNPSSRYADVETMVTDVSHFLDGESVTAYKENIVEKVGRWLGRHRFLVLLVLAYLLMRILVLLFSLR